MGFFTSLKNIFSSGASAEAPAEPAQSAVDMREAEVLVALRAAPPRLSAWLNLLLEGVDSASPLLWSRLAMFFKALEAPEDEASRFIGEFRRWLENMGYRELGEFRSELQYRLALALDLEDEEDEKSRLVLKFAEGLAKTRARLGESLGGLFSSGRSLDDAFWEELEEILIMDDVGVEAALEISTRLKKRAAAQGLGDPAGLRALMREELAGVFKQGRRISAVNPPEVILMVGVNGAGKTTTIAKLAHRYIAGGKKVLVAAGDTFRAAAIEQLEVWARRVGADFYARQHGADPAAVAYEATGKAVDENYDVLFIDTAGRLQTKTNLMEELEKIKRVVGRLHPGAPHRSILVLDANTGQNALSQARLFGQSGGVDEIIVTKLDGTAKGGVAVGIALAYNLPISYIGLGEKMEDLRPFDGAAFASALLGEAE